ncbi:MAG TPA: PaaI family thioesterase [Burkholderiales bacterium]|nr:PaaI family thioesterase [Burkholderiales bacterium]
MAGIEFLRAIRDGRLPHPPICALLGYRLTGVESGHAVFEIAPAEQHYNPIGVVHGGIAMTLLDSAMGCAVQTRMPAGGRYTTLEAKTNLVRAVTADTGALRAVGKVVHVGKRVATAEARLEDREGKLYAHATSTCIVL